MLDINVEQVAIQDSFDYWTIDLKENMLDYNPQKLKEHFLGKKTIHQGLLFKIDEVIFYTYVKDKIVLKTIKE